VYETRVQTARGACGALQTIAPQRPAFAHRAFVVGPDGGRLALLDDRVDNNSNNDLKVILLLFINLSAIEP